MPKALVLAEKPSVAQDIVRALTPVSGSFVKHEEHFENEHYLVTSAVGHLVEIQAPEEYDVKRGKWSFAHLPVIPPYFALKPVEKTRTRLNAITRLAKRADVTELINACDAGREGELIFRLIEQYAGPVRGGQHQGLGKPVRRLWLQSMTPQAIRDGFQHLRSDTQMQGLADAARSRSEADWLVGINGTRAMTAFNSRDGGFFLTTVGRVQTPTLSLVVEREEHIRRFISRDYWEIHAQFAAQAGDYSARWYDPQFKRSDDEHARAERLWNLADAQAIAQAVLHQSGRVEEHSKPSTQASPLLFDLTSLQREANARFGYSAKTTLALAQALYERHKALTYPRTDSRHLPQDYLSVARDTLQALAQSRHSHLAPHAAHALAQGYVRAHKRIFDDSKVSDHFAIIPTPQPPSGLSEAEQKIYDLVSRRFMAVFYPAAEYLITTRITQIDTPALPRPIQHFKSEGKVLVQPGWLAIYGKEADAQIADDKNSKDKTDKPENKTLVPVQPGETVHTQAADIKALKTRPPARYSEATLLGAMESAGKQVEDDELREAMQEKGLGTPATRAAIIEGLLTEKYMLREGRELIPTAKAFQLMTLLRGLQVQELSRADLTGDWEYKLGQIEKGALSRQAFMADIAAMTERIVHKAKEYDRDTIPGDYATLQAPCPTCGGRIKENYRRWACTGVDGQSEGCGFSFTKSPAGRTFETAEAETLVREGRIGPLEGFRSKAGWPFTAEITLSFDQEAQHHKLEFDFGDDKTEGSGELADFSGQSPLGPSPADDGQVYEWGNSYVSERAVATVQNPTPSSQFKVAKVILQQPIEPEQMRKLLTQGQTDVLDKFISNRTRRPFKARLVWDADAQKVGFAFEVREGGKGRAAAKTTARPAAKKAASKTAARSSAKRAVRAPAAGKTPSAALAAVIGVEPVSRPQALKKVWEYIRAQNLQDPQDRRTIVADARLRQVLGRERVGMFEITALLGEHLQ